MPKVIKGDNSVVIVDNLIVLKVPTKFLEYNILSNEIKWLKILEKSIRFPTLISVQKNSFEMEYLGASLNKENLPKDAISLCTGILLCQFFLSIVTSIR